MNSKYSPTGAGQRFNPPPIGDDAVTAPVSGLGQLEAFEAGGQATLPRAETAHPVVDKARRLTDAVRQRAMTTSDDKKSVLAGHVGTLVDRLEGIARPAAGSEAGMDDRLIERGTGILRRFQKALDENSTKDLLNKAEAQIKARPGLFIAGFLALGFMGARLVRK